MSTQGGDRFNLVVLDLVDLALQQACPDDVFRHMKGFCEATLASTASLANIQEPRAPVSHEGNQFASELKRNLLTKHYIS